jgi:hypothetical protein
MMNHRTIQTPLLSLSERVYRMLLIAYPAAYRREYGALMVQVFRDMCRDSYRQGGAAAVALWWCSTLLDLVYTAFEQRRKVRFTVSKSTFMRLTGVLLIVGGAFWSLAAFSQFQPDDHYTYYGIYQLLIWLLAPAFLLVGLGCFGLGLHIRPTLGVLGQWALYGTGIGALVMAVGVVGTSINDDLWNVWMAGGLVHMLALTVFGVLHLWKPALPIFRALPLMLASGWWVMWTSALRTTSQTTNNTLSFLFIVGMGMVWLAIGLKMHRQQSQELVPAAS